MEFVGSVKQPHKRRFFFHRDQLGFGFNGKHWVWLFNFTLIVSMLTTDTEPARQVWLKLDIAS